MYNDGHRILQREVLHLKRLSCLCAAMCLLAGLWACTAETGTTTDPAKTEQITTTEFQSTETAPIYSAQTPEEAQALLDSVAGGKEKLDDKSLLALVDCLRKAEGPRYDTIEQALRGKVSKGGEAYLLAQWAEQDDRDSARCLAYKAAFEQGYHALSKKAASGGGYVGSLYYLNAFLGQYLAYAKAGDPISRLKRQSLEGFLNNDTYRHCMYYKDVQAVYEMCRKSGWVYRDGMREDIQGMIRVYEPGFVF